MEHHPESSDASAEEHAIPSLPARIVQVFVSPAKLFDALRHRPAWMGAVLGLIGLSLALQFLTPVIVPEEVRRTMFETQFVAAGPDPAIAEQQIEFWLQWSPVVFGAGAVFVTPIALSLVAGLLLLAFNVFLGGEGTFRQLFSAGAHAFYINLAGGLVVIVLMVLGSENPVLTPGLFLPEMGGFVGRFVNGINIFAVWTCVVLGVAVSRIYPGRSVVAGTTYLLVLYFLMISLGAAAAGLGG